MKCKLFVRQPFSESGTEEQQLCQNVMNLLLEMQKAYPIEFLTWMQAQHGGSFREHFEVMTGKPFDSKAFRRWRLDLLAQAHGLINIRVGLSESTAFEVACNVTQKNPVPMFFAMWNGAPMKTTMLRELDDMCDVMYVPFDKASDLEPALHIFLQTLTASSKVKTRLESAA